MQNQTSANSETVRPIIGITSADEPTPVNYVNAIERCGGTVLILDNHPERVEEDLARIDGLIVSGGSDVDPALFGEAAHETTKTGDPDRDKYEISIIRRAFDLGVPTLAICRGMQVANVAWGGTVHQHIPDIVDGSVIHKDESRKFDAFVEHMVTADPESFLAKLMQSTHFATNATHHQAVNRLGTGMHAVAHTDDGLVEAIERKDNTAFWLAVQWHPERLLDADEGRSLRLINAFLEAARAAQKLPG
jgi:putative glutamine amidotransferase